MQFKGQLYGYQKEVLDTFETERTRGDHKIHIVAPPGSGKTIMGLEMASRLEHPVLILVPNITLQKQWREKCEEWFLSDVEKQNEYISEDLSMIKPVNILTYQTLGKTQNSETLNNEISTIWYESEKENFRDRENFDATISVMREEAREEYDILYKKYAKKGRESGKSTAKYMTEEIRTYIDQLRAYGVRTLIVDEAHHLTSWWSHVLYEITTVLDEPYIIGLTATPPYEDSDYFELDESYQKLLGEVDYYTPTPAIVKSGQLAPYSDLLTIVKPDNRLQEILKEKEEKLTLFLRIHEGEIRTYLHTVLMGEHEALKKKAPELFGKWSRFIYHTPGEILDMTSYIDSRSQEGLGLEDIAKSIGKWVEHTFHTKNTSQKFGEIKKLLFDLGYIWRDKNFYRFETPLEKSLIYSKSKLDGVSSILENEGRLLGDDLKLAIITDFIDTESDWLTGHDILERVAHDLRDEDIYLVSGQGIWKQSGDRKTLETTEDILSVTQKLRSGEIRCIIGTRGILGEGWDCPELNTLIDLTGVSAYMSVNQIHGRAIRKDPKRSDKVANIYDIVCIGDGYQGLRDFDRIIRKHKQFYGVDDAGIIVKEIDHIYPQLTVHIRETDRINIYTKKKAGLRDMVRELWSVGGAYKNEELFSLSLELTQPYEDYYLPGNMKPQEIQKIINEKNTTNLLELKKTKYHTYFRKWIGELLDAACLILKQDTVISHDLSYQISSSPSGSIKITANSDNPLESKAFIEIISGIFSPPTNEKYLLEFPRFHHQKTWWEWIQLFVCTLLLKFYGKKVVSEIDEAKGVQEKVPRIFYITLIPFVFTLLVLLASILAIGGIVMIGIMVGGVYMIGYVMHRYLGENIHLYVEGIKARGIVTLKTPSVTLPNIIASNEKKRGILLRDHSQELSFNPEKIRGMDLVGFLLISGVVMLTIMSILPYLGELPSTGFLFMIFMFFILPSLYFLSITIVWIARKIIRFGIRGFIIQFKHQGIEGNIRTVVPGDIGITRNLTAKIEKIWK